jgi:hypothetical protein
MGWFPRGSGQDAEQDRDEADRQRAAKAEQDARLSSRRQAEPGDPGYHCGDNPVADIDSGPRLDRSVGDPGYRAQRQGRGVMRDEPEREAAG